MIGGLLFATVATLFFVPVIFRIVHARDHASRAQPTAADDSSATALLR